MVSPQSLVPWWESPSPAAQAPRQGHHHRSLCWQGVLHYPPSRTSPQGFQLSPSNENWQQVAGQSTRHLIRALPLFLPETSRILPESGDSPVHLALLLCVSSTNEATRKTTVQGHPPFKPLRDFSRGYPQRGGNGQQSQTQATEKSLVQIPRGLARPPFIRSQETSQAQAALIYCTAAHPRKQFDIPLGTVSPFPPGGREGAAGCVRSQSSSMCLHRETLRFSKPFQSRQIGRAHV